MPTLETVYQIYGSTAARALHHLEFRSHLNLLGRRQGAYELLFLQKLGKRR